MDDLFVQSRNKIQGVEYVMILRLALLAVRCSFLFLVGNFTLSMSQLDMTPFQQTQGILFKLQ